MYNYPVNPLNEMKKNGWWSVFVWITVGLFIGLANGFSGGSFAANQSKKQNRISFISKNDVRKAGVRKNTERKAPARPVIRQASDTDIYGWLRFDTRNQDEYGICRFSAGDPSSITVLYPHDQEKVACAGAYANGKYYFYLYRPLGDKAVPLSFGTFSLADGTYKEIADYTEMTTLFADMTYDYSAQVMYALGRYGGNNFSTLLAVDLKNGGVTPVADLDRIYVTLACSYEGQLYAIDLEEGNLYTIDKVSGYTKPVGNTFELPEVYVQSMEFDHHTNTLYWAGNNIYEEGFLATVDTETGESFRTGYLGNDAQVVGLYIPFNKIEAEAPGAVTGLEIIPGAGGRLSAVLRWQNPSADFSGNELASLEKIEIYRNEILVYTDESPVIGGTGEWTDTGMENGFSTYRLVAVNEKGAGESVTATPFIGRDIPAAPTNIGLVKNGNDGVISWTAPGKGMHGGWIDEASLNYRIVRYPDTVTVVSELTATEYTDTSITALAAYSYRIQAMTSDGEGGAETSGTVVIGPPLTVPYLCNFATDEEFALWQPVDQNGDSFTWRRETTLAAAYYYYNEDDETIGGDDWLISSPVRLEKGKTYRLSFKLQSYDVGYPEKVAVWIGQGDSPEAMVTRLGDYTVESPVFVAYRVMLPDQLETGDYNLGFYCHSDPYMFILYLTGVKLEEVSEGSVSGRVTAGGVPVAGVQVKVEGTDHETQTDETGSYALSDIKAGTYALSYMKEGYETVVKNGIAVNKGENTEVNLTVEKLPVYPLSGKIVNAEGKPVPDAVISLDGYASFCSRSGPNGDFLLEGVYRAGGYVLTVQRYGLRTYTDTLDMSGGRVLPDIVLYDKFLAPYGVGTEENEAGVSVTWSEPLDLSVFRHDNGKHNGRLGKTGATEKSVYGAVFRTPAKLTGMTWYTENYLQSHPFVDVFVFALDESGEPTSTILFHQSGVPNTDNEWTSFDFPHPVEAYGGYMLGLSYAGHVGLGLDNGEGPDYPFEEKINCYTDDYETGEFIYTETHDIRRSLMIRAKGIPEGEDEKPSVTSEKRYKVWRLQEDRTDRPGDWTLLTAAPLKSRQFTDTEWAGQPQGFYRYAVRTVYTGDTLSEAAFSPVLIKDMLTSVTVKVKTATPHNEAEGATVTLVNEDGDETHVYTGKTDIDGQAIFDEVWKGIYTISVRLKGFVSAEEAGADFTAEPAYRTGTFTLAEYKPDPFHLKITDTETPNEWYFSWNEPDYRFDDFESHTDFAVNSPGTAGWQYIDGDGQKTYGLEDVDFPNSGKQMAYIIFNPWETDPKLAVMDSHIRAYSGEKYLATFPANPAPNNDFIISPELHFTSEFIFKFQAKSYSSDYGLERMNVGYSKGDMTPEDFVWLNEEGPMEVRAGEWTEYRYAIPADARYVTINCVSDNVLILMIDDLFVGRELPEGTDPDNMKDNIRYEIYLDGAKVGETTGKHYLFGQVAGGTHKAGVRAVYSSGVSGIREIEFTESNDVGLERNGLTGIALYPNPAKDRIVVTGDYEKIEIVDAAGCMIATYRYGETVSVKGLDNGFYFVRVISGNRTETFKLIVER